MFPVLPVIRGVPVVLVVPVVCVIHVVPIVLSIFIYNTWCDVRAQ